MILGHGSNMVASNYGSDYGLKVMRDHMERVLAKLDPTRAVL